MGTASVTSPLPDDYPVWLGKDAVREVVELLRPFPSEPMQAYRVSTAFNSPKNDGPQRIEAVE